MLSWRQDCNNSNSTAPQKSAAADQILFLRGDVCSEHHPASALRTYVHSLISLSLPASRPARQAARQGRDRREDVKTFAKNSDEWAHFTRQAGGQQTPPDPRIFLLTAVEYLLMAVDVKLAIVFVLYSVTKQCNINGTTHF